VQMHNLPVTGKDGKQYPAKKPQRREEGVSLRTIADDTCCYDILASRKDTRLRVWLSVAPTENFCGLFQGRPGMCGWSKTSSAFPSTLGVRSVGIRPFGMPVYRSSMYHQQ